MVSMWKKMKLLLSRRVCMIAPLDPADLDGQNSEVCRSHSQPIPKRTSEMRRVASFSYSHSGPITIDSSAAPSAPHLSFSGPIVSSASCGTGPRSSRSTCAICLESMKPGHGQALFTAECSHTFHFSCITSNVRHGNQICPVCRARWNDVPWQVGMEVSRGPKGRTGSHQRIPSEGTGSHGDTRFHIPSFHSIDESIRNEFLYTREPNSYNDDEPLDRIASMDDNTESLIGTIDQKVSVEAFAEFSAVPAHESRQHFTMSVHLKAPPARTSPQEATLLSSRAPLDLVAVIDISGSMSGRKLTLLKQAMSFMVRNLSANDRMSVVAFSSTAKRIFPLRRMGEDGQRHALQALDALIATGGTNIAEGLRKGVKVLEDCRERNPVCSIMLLSDGQDTYNLSSHTQLPFFLTRGLSDPRRLVPRSIRRSAGLGQAQAPVHTFGFGADHDAATMHAISEVSAGTFSYIQAEETVQDAFAQCIGGLLSVVAQDVQLTISCSAPGVLIGRIRAGSYTSSILDNGRHGVVKLGDLYAEEERDVLLDLKFPEAQEDAVTMPLVRAGCIYKDPVSQETIQSVPNELSIGRPRALAQGDVVASLEVDRQRNRLRTAEAIAKSRALADQGNIEAAQCCLCDARVQLGSSLSALAGDRLCAVLDSELNEIQERMANRQLYESSGRAYLLSAHSSHLRQRATTRGDSVDGLVHDYQTPSMVDMITLSQQLR